MICGSERFDETCHTLMSRRPFSASDCPDNIVRDLSRVGHLRVLYIESTTIALGNYKGKRRAYNHFPKHLKSNFTSPKTILHRFLPV